VGGVAHPGDGAPATRGSADGRREVPRTEGYKILPDSTVDDTDAGWGERAAGNDERLLADRPPHWG
jgi:hypothetical protein